MSYTVCLVGILSLQYALESGAAYVHLEGKAFLGKLRIRPHQSNAKIKISLSQRACTTAAHK